MAGLTFHTTSKMVFDHEAAFEAFAANERAAQSGFSPVLGWGVCRVEYSPHRPDVMMTGCYPFLNWAGQNGLSLAAFQHVAQMADPDFHTHPEVVLDITDEMIEALKGIFKPYWEKAKGRKHPNVQVVKCLDLAKTMRDDTMFKNAQYKLVFLRQNVQSASLPAIYMKLMALSKRFVQPGELNLDGIFGVLPNIGWKDDRVYDLDYLRDHEVYLKMMGLFPHLDYVDKLPRYLMHVIPDDDVRILSSHNVRFGAHVAPKTTVMPGASYINFNAGTLGKAMVEGRISSSATVGEGTDVGGGASILGTLSGGNKIPIVIGRHCLLGANSVTGIPLGDGCIVDAGVAVLAGSKVTIYGQSNLDLIKAANPGWNPPTDDNFLTCKAIDLRGLNKLHFRVGSDDGEMIAMFSKREVPLNDALHA